MSKIIFTHSFFLEDYVPENSSKCSSRTGSPTGSDDINAVEKPLDIAQEDSDIKNDLTVNGFIDLSYFKRYHQKFI